MELIASIRKRIERLHYVWSWRLRYWWLDTPGGARAHRWTFAVSLVATVLQVTNLFVRAMAPRPPNQPAESYGWIVILIISVIIAYAMRPKPQNAKPQDAQGPTVTDGQSVKRHYGEVWISDEFVLAWKMMGTEPIKSKGGKK